MNKSHPSVLLVGNFLSQHVGTRAICEELSVRLEKSGWEVSATSNKLTRISRLFDMLLTTISHSKSYQVACIDVFSGPAFFWAEVIVRLLVWLHKPSVVVLHGGALPDFAKKYPDRVCKLLSMASLAITPSRFIQTNLSSFRADIQYLPNAIDLSKYYFRVRENPTPRLIWLRAFHEIYHPQLAIRAMSYLVEDFKNIHLTMIGPDKHDGSLESARALAGQLGVYSHINIVGSIPKLEVPNKLAEGDIFLNTTRFESFGVSVLEAAACGLPIVSTSVGELPYLWQNEENALLVPADDPREMAEAIRRILSEPGLAESLSKNARQKAEAYDWAHILPQWESLLHGVQSA